MFVCLLVQRPHEKVNFQSSELNDCDSAGFEVESAKRNCDGVLTSQWTPACTADKAQQSCATNVQYDLNDQYVFRVKQICENEYGDSPFSDGATEEYAQLSINMKLWGTINPD